MSPRKEIIGPHELWLGDCREILPTLGRVDAVVTDPPYGQSQNTNVVGPKGLRTYRCGAEGGGARVIDGNAKVRVAAGGIHSTRMATKFPDAIHGDDGPFDPAPLLALAPIVLLWGAHRFSSRLPDGTWLLWDKVPTGKIRDQGDGEAAWMSGAQKPMRIFRLLWDGVCVGSAARSEVTAGQSRVHPTQKPVALMEWCLDQIQLSAGSSVLDPFMGAGSTGVAAAKKGLRFIGVEIEPIYFETACRRVEEAIKQTDLFIEQPKPKAEQLSLLSEATP